MLAKLFGSTRRRWGAAIVACVIGLGLAGYAVHGQLPAASAYGAEVLRGFIGDQAVAELEGLVYRTQDKLNQSAYSLGAAQPVAPWPTSSPIRAAAATAQAPGPVVAFTSTPVPASQPGTGGGKRASSGPVNSATSLTPEVTEAGPAPAIATPWPPALQTRIGAGPGTLPGAGQWSSYLLGPSGQLIGARTFIQPDPQRPYAVVAIVAFDLKRSRLHFVLGTNEPTSDVPLTRTGLIPPQDSQPGVLLATFNGGFKARHGHSGAMVDGVTVLLPRTGFATVAMYRDGHVRMGAWGVSLTASRDMVAWRQNGPLIIQDGQINPHTLDAAPQDWGYSLDGNTAVWRSGLGLSADGQTLYYVAGPHLTMPVLASALVASGAAQAMQLDINNFWVHFDDIQAAGNRLQAVPLVAGMDNGVGRYLEGYSRDFFYITANGN